MHIHPIWKILLYVLLCIIGMWASAVFFAVLGLRDPVLPGLLGITTATWIAIRLMDHGDLCDLGLNWESKTPFDLAVGLILPPLLIGAVFALEWAVGWLLVADAGPLTMPFAAQIVWRFGVIAWYEELFARGYLLQTFAKFSRPFQANFLAALVFAGLHCMNPGFTMSAFAGVLMAGLLLGLCFQVTHSLYLPIAFHLSWNLSQAALGFPVSGTAQPGLLQLVREGPPLYTGGAFGPEAGLLGFAAVLIAVGLVWQYGNLRGYSPANTSPKPL